MRHSPVVVSPAASERVFAAYEQLRKQTKLPDDFGLDVAADLTSHQREWPGEDWSEIEFWTVDPEGAQDLDQAIHLEETDSGYLVRYAIADLSVFIQPQGATDREAWRRGQTVYLPADRIPLYPPQLSEGDASLLPERTRPAYVWQLELDQDGALTSTGLTRAMVRSRRRFTYEEVQAELDADTADQQLQLLRTIGQLRQKQEQDRGGASLRIPQQEVSVEDGRVVLGLRPPVPCENWNAQISLLTGMAAAAVMVEHKIGILRTLPDPAPDAVRKFREHAKVLETPWAEDVSLGDFLRTLDTANPDHLALMYQSPRLFRGADYTPLAGELPEVTTQAAVAGEYAHTTAPLRRLVDRYTLATCEALLNGRTVPQWVVDALPKLPKVMRTADRRADTADRRAVNIAEAAVLAEYVGKSVEGVVVSTKTGGGYVNVQFRELPVVVPIKPQRGHAAPLGEVVTTTVESVDVDAGTVELSPIGAKA